MLVGQDKRLKMKCKSYSAYTEKICDNDTFYMGIDKNCMQIYCTKCGKIEIKMVI